mmetsp:Transcript_14442/g.29619  ORF Transcript_14442/g.29619 Transcript_14442/m.29619 type:complete len:231 (+) Transcript_14442:606-1298(+)
MGYSSSSSSSTPLALVPPVLLAGKEGVTAGVGGACAMWKGRLRSRWRGCASPSHPKGSTKQTRRRLFISAATVATVVAAVAVATTMSTRTRARTGQTSWPSWSNSLHRFLRRRLLPSSLQRGFLATKALLVVVVVVVVLKWMRWCGGKRCSTLSATAREKSLTRRRGHTAEPQRGQKQQRQPPPPLTTARVCRLSLSCAASLSKGAWTRKGAASPTRAKGFLGRGTRWLL